MSDPILTVDGVCFSYRSQPSTENQNLNIDIPVLNEISFSIRAGESVAIKGPSGSGKSTLLYVLGGLLKPQKGKVQILGRSLYGSTESERAQIRNTQIGFIFQQFHLLPKTTALANILLPSEYSSITSSGHFDARARELSRRLGISDRLDHLPNQLSGGQQQRVAVARALLCNAPLLLADEPTGNLDSKSSEQLLDLLMELKTEGKGLLIITHDSEVAKRCDRVLNFIDGKIVSEIAKTQVFAPYDLKSNASSSEVHTPKTLKKAIQSGLENLKRNKTRSILTMLGITIGIASLLAMVSAGQFTKRKILDSYTTLGVNTLLFRAYPNWTQKATDTKSAIFRSFSMESDLFPLPKIFNQITDISPLLLTWNGSASFGGATVDSDVRILGVGPRAFEMTGRELQSGNGFGNYHIRERSPVCVIGNEISKRLFKGQRALGKVIQIGSQKGFYGCRVIGVLKTSSNSKDYLNPNLQVSLPYSFFQINAGYSWDAEIHEVLVNVTPGTDIARLSDALKSWFNRKYGKSINLSVDSDALLLSQMRRFLGLFTALLTTIALIALAVAGIGITNMMLVSVNERYREIGIRKALGATDLEIRGQFLWESVLLCTFAGILGLGIGWGVVQAAIYCVSIWIPSVAFEWVWEGWAFALSIIAILGVGIFSGIFPALKAQKLQVIEALRYE